MRVLVTTSPSIAHVLIMIPLAWGLRAQGHDVLVATGGPGVELVGTAGLPLVDTAPGTDHGAIFGRHAAGARRDAHTSGGAEAVAMFAELGAAHVEGTRELVARWAPDLVVHGALDGAGALAAAEAGVPRVEHEICPTDPPGAVVRALWPELCARTGSPLAGSVPPDPRHGVAIAPPGFFRPADRSQPMRLVPHTVGGPVPALVLDPPRAPRVLVTLGTVAPGTGGAAEIAAVAAALAGDGHEVVVALGRDPSSVPELADPPPGVRVAWWLPLPAVLATCRAVVHHGGSGTTLAALAAGVPQVVSPRFADQFRNAAALVAHGCGARVEGSLIDGGVLGRARAAVRDVDGAAAAAARATVDALPPPAQVAAELVASTPVGVAG